ncbi:hypothetical protein D917_00889 [Trichinella nativa]|uniref:Uncharacterized protein n=1 Tax=Trichinella nativa TaxID=6335 RepID=A0A1Y3E7L5_9BILA|nr:hypothetical protein D917_00889 [Trichinella nativa]
MSNIWILPLFHYLEMNSQSQYFMFHNGERPALSSPAGPHHHFGATAGHQQQWDWYRNCVDAATAAAFPFSAMGTPATDRSTQFILPNLYSSFNQSQTGPTLAMPTKDNGSSVCMSTASQVLPGSISNHHPHPNLATAQRPAANFPMPTHLDQTALPSSMYFPTPTSVANMRSFGGNDYVASHVGPPPMFGTGTTMLDSQTATMAALANHCNTNFYGAAGGYSSQVTMHNACVSMPPAGTPVAVNSPKSSAESPSIAVLPQHVLQHQHQQQQQQVDDVALLKLAASRGQLNSSNKTALDVYSQQSSRDLSFNNCFLGNMLRDQQQQHLQSQSYCKSTASPQYAFKPAEQTMQIPLSADLSRYAAAAATAYAGPTSTQQLDYLSSTGASTSAYSEQNTFDAYMTRTNEQNSLQPPPNMTVHEIYRNETIQSRLLVSSTQQHQQQQQRPKQRRGGSGGSDKAKRKEREIAELRPVSRTQFVESLEQLKAPLVLVIPNSLSANYEEGQQHLFQQTTSPIRFSPIPPACSPSQFIGPIPTTTTAGPQPQDEFLRRHKVSRLYLVDPLVELNRNDSSPVRKPSISKVPVYKKTQKVTNETSNDVASIAECGSPYSFTEEEEKSGFPSSKVSANVPTSSSSSGAASADMAASPAVVGLQERLIEDEVKQKLLNICTLHPELKGIDGSSSAAATASCTNGGSSTKSGRKKRPNTTLSTYPVPPHPCEPACSSTGSVSPSISADSGGALPRVILRIPKERLGSYEPTTSSTSSPYPVGDETVDLESIMEPGRCFSAAVHNNSNSSNEGIIQANNNNNNIGSPLNSMFNYLPSPYNQTPPFIDHPPPLLPLQPVVIDRFDGTNVFHESKTENSSDSGIVCDAKMESPAYGMHKDSCMTDTNASMMLVAPNMCNYATAYPTLQAAFAMSNNSLPKTGNTYTPDMYAPSNQEVP